MADVTEKEIEVARIVRPKFLSLVNLPANQIAFKVLRDDKGDPEMTVPHITRKRTVARSELLVSIEFGEDAAEEQIAEFLADWGITEFTVETAGDKKRVKCSDSGDKPTMQINMKGYSVTVLQPISKRSDGKNCISVAALRFDKEAFPEISEVSEWLRGQNLEYPVESVQNTDTSYVVVGGEPVAEGEDTRLLEIEKGVQLTVRKSLTADIPDSMAASVTEAAYGSWGWGQLDFVATMADVEFCGVSRDATELLEQTIRQILYYNELPLDVRKALVTNATSQFASFIATLIDALPTRVVVANRPTLTKEIPVSNDATQTTAETTSTADPVAVVATPTPTSVTTDTPVVQTPSDTITRAEVAEMIKAAVSAAVAAATPAAPVVAARSDAPAATAATAATLTDGETLRETLRSVQALGDSVKLVAERVQSLEGSTTVRSDGGDTAPNRTKDVFLGMFGKASA